MLTVIETPIFQHYATEVWSDQEREALRKVRWARAGMGKRGGARVIYFVRNSQGEIVLLIVYSKAKFDNLSPDFLHRLKEASNGS